MNAENPSPDVVERLKQHRTLSRAPEQELQWFAARVVLRRLEAGEYLGRKGQSLDEAGLGSKCS
jgi:hypothetical protein